MSPTFYCMAEEIGDSGTPHIHVYVVFPTPRRFSTIQRRFPTAHIETAYGTAEENVNYIKKEGQFADKSHTSVKGSYVEYGKMPISKDAEFDIIMDMIKEGSSVADVVVTYPKLMYRVQQLENLRNEINQQRYGIADRDVKVIHLICDTTSDPFDYVRKHERGKICRIVTYRDPMSFDVYNGEDVMLFENYVGQIPFKTFAMYLDKHPVTLPARFHDRQACYTRVYIATHSEQIYQNSENARFISRYIDETIDLRRKPRHHKDTEEKENE